LKPKSNQKRLCGDCTACCFTHAVSELKKSDGQLCRHCKNEACAIYSHRPQSCRDFRCEWLKGFGPDHWRPDKIGLLLDFVADERLISKCLLQIWEIRPNIFSSAAAKQIIDQVAKRQIAIACFHLDGKKQFILPAGVALPLEAKTAIEKEGFRVLLYSPFLKL